MLFALPALLLSLASLVAAQAEPTCSRATECQQLAQDAAARGDFEAFHTLAWRAVQTGRPNDPDLMFMLARAQSLSGRADDALVMLARLADRGVVHAEVETIDDFNRVRLLPGWPSLLEKLRGVAATPAPSASVPAESSRPATERSVPPARAARSPSTSSKPALTKRPTASAEAAAPNAPNKNDEPSLTVVPPTNTIAVPPAVSTPVAMAYDKVSGRLIIADDSSGTLKVVSELSGNATDLVSPGWGGGYHTNALVIDSKRGDLWVVGSKIGGQQDSIIHRLQLISGRLLYSVPHPDDSGPTRFAALALSSASVFVLDAEGGRIFELSGAARTLRLRATVTERDPTALTLAGDTVAYVAHAGGILRIDLGTKQSESIKSSPGISLDGIEWIGHFDNSLLALQRHSDGTMAAVRLRFDRRGRTLTAVDTFGPATGKGAAVLGDVFFYMSTAPDGTAVARVNLRAPSQARANPPKP